MLFREVGVPEYWIVDLDARVIERSTPTDMRPEIIVDRLEWLPEGAGAPLVIELPDFFANALDR
jgi:Uma2 family endonuclease